jgi:hypothetical protein
MPASYGSDLERAFARAWLQWCPGLPAPVTQYSDIEPWLEHLQVRKQLKPRSRRWIADYCWPEQKVVCEIQGGTWKMGGHSSGVGIERDCTKAVTLAAAGWLFFPLTKEMVKRKDGLFIKALAAAVEQRSIDPWQTGSIRAS